MPDRRDDTSVNSSVQDLEEREETRPASGEDPSLEEREPEGDDALARDDLPKEERIDHQNDLA